MTCSAGCLESVWHDQVASRCVYRGMSLGDLADPLDPVRNPHAEALPLVETCLAVLQRLVDTGFSFTIVETHWGRSWEHDLENIVTWSRNDLDHPRIDFTSSIQAAREYSDNWHGSQLKQNLKSITEHLPEQRDDALLKQVLTVDDWTLLEQVHRWVNLPTNQHRGIVLWLRRSHPALHSRNPCAPVGTLSDFRERVLRELGHRGLGCNETAVMGLLPQEPGGFDAYLTGPLRLKDIERIEETSVPGDDQEELTR